MELLIGSRDGDHIIIDVGHADGTAAMAWVPCKFDIVAGAWRGSVEVSLVTIDFQNLRTQLQSLYDSLAGSARFETMERQIKFDCTMNELGHISISGFALDRLGDGNRLTFEFTIDQSYLPDIISRLHAIETTFNPDSPVA